MQADFFQLGYVTNDFNQAMRDLGELHGIQSFKQMHDLHLPTGAGREAVAHYALAFKLDVQYEIIAPLAGDVGIYRDAIPDSGYALRLHHLGRFYGTLLHYEARLKAARARWRMPIDYGAFGGFYAYADARQEVGHYMEFFSFPSDEFFADVPRY